MPYDSVIENMKVNSTFQVDGFNASNTLLDEQLARVNEEITSLENFLHEKADLIRNDLELKRDSFFSGDDIYYGPQFDNISYDNPTDWKIYDSATMIDVFIYHGVGWDSLGVIEVRIEVNVSKWHWTWKYLNEPVGAGGTFGLYAKRDQLNMSKTLNNASKTQIQQTNVMLT